MLLSWACGLGRLILVMDDSASQDLDFLQVEVLTSAAKSEGID